jgi:hypothetical protein
LEKTYIVALASLKNTYPSKSTLPYPEADKAGRLALVQSAP